MNEIAKNNSDEVFRKSVVSGDVVIIPRENRAADNLLGELVLS